MKRKKFTHGGKRVRSGRKKAQDKKLQVTSYIKTSTIESLGGMEKTKEAINEWVENLEEFGKPTSKQVLIPFTPFTFKGSFEK